MIRKLFLPLVAGLTLTACPLDITGRQSSLEDLPEGLEVSLTVEPGEVRQHEPFSVHLRVANTTTETIPMVTAGGCLAIPKVIRDGERVPFKGSWWGCTGAITTHTLAPGEIRLRSWDMYAELYAEHTGDPDGAPAPKGAYRVQAEFYTYAEGGSGPNPAVESSLRVH